MTGQLSDPFTLAWSCFGKIEESNWGEDALLHPGLLNSAQFTAVYAHGVLLHPGLLNSAQFTAVYAHGVWGEFMLRIIWCHRLWFTMGELFCLIDQVPLPWTRQPLANKTFLCLVNGIEKKSKGGNDGLICKR